MSRGRPYAFIVDRQVEVRRSLSDVLEQAGFRPRLFSSAAAFLAAHDPLLWGCVLMDVGTASPGFPLENALCSIADERPVIALTTSPSIEASVQALRAGAVNFLPKVVAEHRLIAAVLEAVALDAHCLPIRKERQLVAARFASLTVREFEVLRAVLDGRLNKQIAAELGIVEKTVKFHRASLMSKMGAKTLVELIWMDNLRRHGCNFKGELTKRAASALRPPAAARPACQRS
jgi:FixJ family two-component response regulator